MRKSLSLLVVTLSANNDRMVTANIAIACFTKGFCFAIGFWRTHGAGFRFLVFAGDEAGI